MSMRNPQTPGGPPFPGGSRSTNPRLFHAFYTAAAGGQSSPDELDGIAWPADANSTVLRASLEHELTTIAATFNDGDQALARSDARAAFAGWAERLGPEPTPPAEDPAALAAQIPRR